MYTISNITSVHLICVRPGLVCYQVYVSRIAIIMDSDWLPHHMVYKMLADRGGSLDSYVEKSALRALNASRDLLVIVREHQTWFIEGRGWQVCYSPPKKGGLGRQVINCYNPSSGCQLPVPESTTISSVSWEGEAFVFKTNKGVIRSTPRQLNEAISDSSRLNLSEEKMETNLRKLDGRAPLEMPRSTPKNDRRADRGNLVHDSFDDAELGRVAWDSDGLSWDFEIAMADGRRIAATYDPSDYRLPPAEQGWYGIKACVRWLQENESAARDYLADRLFYGWMEDWRDEDHDVNTIEEFRQKLTIGFVNFGEDQEARLNYEDGNLFGGHCFCVHVNDKGEYIGDPDMFG